MERLVIDTETGGLRPQEHSLLTVGMLLVDVTPKRLEFVDEAHVFVKHDEYNVSRMALAVNGIDLHEHNKIGVFADKACGQINSFVDKHVLYETPILGHNVHFDVGFISALFEGERLKYPFCRAKDDTRFIWQRFKREGRVSPFTNAKLGTIASHFDIDYSKAHDALEDCRITAKCFQGMLKMKWVV
jgi:DNA polymerase III epsilon subunit-like protein